MSTFKLKEMDPTPDKTVPFSKEPLRKKLLVKACTVWANVTVEPLIAAIGLCSQVCSVAVQHLNMEKACRLDLQYGDEICTVLMTHRNRSIYREHRLNCISLVADLHSWSKLFLNLFPFLLLLFIGAYSDRTQRRKPFLLAPFIGYGAMSVGLILSATFFEQVSLVYSVVIETVLLGLFGHSIVMLMAIYTYISAITASEERAFRIGLVVVTNSMFNLLGSAIAADVVKHLGNVGTFFVVLLVYVSCFLYTLLFVREIDRSHLDTSSYSPKNQSLTIGHRSVPVNTRSGIPGNNSSRIVNFVSEFFNFVNVRETIVFLLRGRTIKEDPSKKDPKKHLKIILILVNVMILIDHDFPFEGEKAVLYQYTKLTFHWKQANSNAFYTIFYLTDFIGTVFCVAFFTKFLRISDSLVGIISVVSTLCGTLIFAFAHTSFIFCFGALVSLFSDASFIAVRAIISKLTTAEELGKGMSIFMMFEAIAPLIYNPLYSAVYSATVSVWPSTFLIVSCFLASPALFIFIWFYRQENQIKPELNQKRRCSIIMETGSIRRNDTNNSY